MTASEARTRFGELRERESRGEVVITRHDKVVPGSCRRGLARTSVVQ